MRWLFAIALLAFGILIFDGISKAWAFASVFILALPLVCQFSKSDYLRYWSLWLGVFIVAQTAISVWVSERPYKTLPSNMHQIIDVKDEIVGIQGLQTITTDAKGFRVTKPVDYDSTASFRVFTIGGSTTEQIFLDDKKTWSHLLQERLSVALERDVEVINTGVSGLRAVHHLATLQAVTAYHPDLVIIMVGINDWNWHISETQREEAGYSLLDKARTFRARLLLRETLLGKLVLAQLTAQPEGTVRVERGEHQVPQRGSLKSDVPFAFTANDVHPSYQQNLQSISAACTDNAIPCLFVTQATAYQAEASQDLRDNLWMTPPDEDYTVDFETLVDVSTLYNEYLLRFAGQNGHSYCDVAKSIAPNFDHLYDDCHFNANGTRQVAALIADCVIGASR